MINSKYKHIIFDADDTLVDYALDSDRAFRAALVAVGHENDEELLRAWIDFDFGNWDKIGLSDVHLPEVQNSFHELYRRHVRDIFGHGVKIGAYAEYPDEAERIFYEEFAMPGIELGNARAVVAALKEKYRVYAATNGLTSLQHGRLQAFPLDGLFVSEELGTIKPSREFFMRMLEALGAKPDECLMVGDSLSSDIAGARAAGIDCIWLNRHGRPCPDDVQEIKSLDELLEIL